MDGDIIDTMLEGTFESFSSRKSIWNRLFLVTIAFLFFVRGNAQQQYKVKASSLNVRSSPSKKGVKTGRKRGIWVWCFGAVWVFLNANPDIGVMVWWVAVLDGFVNWALFKLLSRNLEAHECSFCNEYADHTLVGSNLISREFRTEYAGEKTIGSGRITFSSSDIPDEPYL